MAYEQKPNTGALFKNDYKKEDKHPDWKGNILCKCPECNREYERGVALWERRSKAGNEYTSITIGEPSRKKEGGNQNATRSKKPAPVVAPQEEEDWL